MNWRKRKKVAFCSHRCMNSFMVTDDPYPMYMHEDFCLKRYHEQFEQLWEKEGMESICENCKGFTVSRPCIIKHRRTKELIKESMRFYKKQDRIAFKNGTLQKNPINYIKLREPF